MLSSKQVKTLITKLANKNDKIDSVSAIITDSERKQTVQLFLFLQGNRIVHKGTCFHSSQASDETARKSITELFEHLENKIK